jgi:hypothetical protein
LNQFFFFVIRYTRLVLYSTCILYLILYVTYYWTVSLILDHSYLVGESTSSKSVYTKVSGF